METRPEENPSAIAMMAKRLRELEAELEHTRVLLLAALEQAPAGVVLAQREPRKVLVSSLAALGIIGKTEPTRDVDIEDHHSGWRLLKPDGSEWPTKERPLRRALDQGVQSRGVEAIIERPDGERRWVEFNTAPVYDREGELTGGVVVFQDVTTMKEMQEERAATLSFFAHDMKSPLVAMNGLLVRLLDGKAGELNPKQREYLQVISGQAKRVLSLSMDFLDMARLGADGGKLATTRVDTAALLGQVAAEYDLRCRELKREFLYRASPGLPELEGDPFRLGRLLGNLLDNALRYGRGQVSLTAEVSPGQLCLSICDRGPGLSGEDIEKVFEPFHRGTAASGSEGTGLGLSAVKAIAEAHGGRVVASNREGGGALFTVCLPVV